MLYSVVKVLAVVILMEWKRWGSMASCISLESSQLKTHANILTVTREHYGYVIIHAVYDIPGFSNGQANLWNGMRWSTAHAYLRPAMDRPNLDVAIHSHVDQVR